MKRIILLMFCMIFLVGTTSAFEFDNRLTYSNDDLKIELRNWFGLGTNYGSAELKSHPSVNYVKEVGAGDQIVMWYDFNFTELYSNGLGNVEFIDVKTGETIDRNYSFVYWGDKQVNVYGQGKCNINVNGTKTCESVIIGTQTIQNWIPYNSRDIPKGEIRIGLKTYVEVEDLVDGIWTIGGKKVSRHSVWTSSLNIGLLAYYSFDASASTVVRDNVTDTFNGTMGSLAGRVIPGFLINSFKNNQSETYDIDFSSIPQIAEETTFSISVWVNDSLTSSNLYFFTENAGDSNFILLRVGSDARSVCGVRTSGISADAASNISLVSGSFTHIVCTRNGADVRLYVNDSLVGTGSNAGLTSFTSNEFVIGSGGNLVADSFAWRGGIDEVGIWNRTLTDAEVTQLFNNGIGITFTTAFSPEITNVFPANNSILTSGTLNVTADVDGSGTLINVSIFVDGILNQTNTSTLDTNYSFDLILSDKVYNVIWEAYNTIERTQLHNRFTIDTKAPQNLNITSPFGFVLYHVSGETLKVNWNVSDLTINTCRILLNNINTTVTCSDNTTQITNVNNISATEIVFYANDTLGNSSTINRTFTYSAFQNAIFFNSTSFETKQETFTLNITTNSTTPANVELIYNGTTFTSGIVTSIAGNNFNISRTINVLTGTGNKTFNFNFTLSGREIQGTDNQQNVAGTLFGLCNGTLTVSHLNFTFRNETLAQENVNATISSTWVYSLGDLIGATKSLIFSNAIENANYTFCLIPSTLPLNINVNLTYNNDISQQRSFSLTTILTNITTTQVLFLLPTALGIFSPFKTATITGDTLIDVRAVITRTLGGSIIDITSGFTDGSGFITFFLDPDETYSAIFSKTGFADNSFSFIPTADLRTVVMGQGPTAIGNGSTIARGLIHNITPTNLSLANNTNVNFSFFVSSNETITLISFNITNETNTELLFVSATTQGLISGILNTGNQTRLIGTYLINTSTQIISFKRIWVVGNQFEGDYSIYRQLTLFNDYGFSDFIRILMVIFSITIIMVFLTRSETIDTSESKVIVTTLLIWAFSLVGWLDTGLVTATDSTGINRLAQLSSQFGIAIISTGVASFFVLRRVFIRRI